MQMDHISNEAMRAYLLGILPEDQSAALEQEYFVNRTFFLRVKSAETALIQDYLDDRLTPSDRQCFERRYLAIPDLQRRLDEVRREHAAHSPDVRSSPSTRLWLRLSFAGAVAAAIAIGIWLYEFRLDERPKVVTDGSSHGSSEQVAVPEGAGSFIYLTPGLTKGSAAQLVEFQQPPATATLNLILQLPGQSSPVQRTVQISLVNPDESQTLIWSSPQPLSSTFNSGPEQKPPPERSSQALKVPLPSSLFRLGDYLVKVSTTDGKSHESYFYRVTARK